MRPEIETRIGRLKFSSSHPGEDVARDFDDELDYQRAVQAYLWAVPLVNAVGFWRALIDAGVSPTEPTLLVFDRVLKPDPAAMTGGAQAIYAFTILDLAKTGPVVADIPAGPRVNFWDFHHRGLADMAPAGDGRGGRFLLLPPGHNARTPGGYIPVRSRTNKIFGGTCGLLESNNGPERQVELVSGIKLYPLARAADPAPTRVILNGDRPFKQDWPEDLRYFDHIIDGLAAEPIEPEDRLLFAMLGPLGIEPNEPFEPDDRERKILSEAATTAVAMVTTTAFAIRLHGRQVWPDRQWERNFFPTTPELQTGRQARDDRAQGWYQPIDSGRYIFAGALRAGEAQWHCSTFHDRRGEFLDGSHQYRLRLRAGALAKASWSITIYDNATCRMIDTDQRHAAVSTDWDLKANADGSVDVYFAPEASFDADANWIKTIPDAGFFVVFRLHGPLQPVLDGTWKLNDVERIG